MAERLQIGAVGHVIAEVIAHAREMLANLRQEVVGRHTRTSRTWSAPDPRRKPSAAAAVKLLGWDRYQFGIEQEFDDAEAKLKQTRDKTVQTAKDAADASAAAASKTSGAVALRFAPRPKEAARSSMSIGWCRSRI